MGLHIILAFLSILHTSGLKTAACETPESPTNRVAAVLIQQNEFELLGDWITYHGGIFGYSHLYIIDNRSTLPAVKNMLALAGSMGAHIFHDNESYRFRYRTVTRVMKEVFKNDTSVDFIIPLDADEFIVSRDGQRYTTSPERILGEIESLPEDGFKYKFAIMSSAACKVSRLEPSARRGMNAVRFGRPYLGSRNKTFYHRKGFISTDQGNHEGRVAVDDICDKASESELEKLKKDGVTEMEGRCFHKTGLALVHYANQAQTFESYKAKMKRGFEAYGHSLENECGGNGVHYCLGWKAIVEDEDGERKKFEETVCHSSYTESTFIAAALLGDRSKYLEFPSDAQLP